jgi:hypothetical protein
MRTGAHWQGMRLQGCLLLSALLRHLVLMFNPRVVFVAPYAAH